MKVLKFGGSSIGSAEKVKNVLGIIETSSQNDPILIVVSAFGGVTDQLIEIAQTAKTGDKEYQQKLDEFEAAHRDFIKNLISESARPAVGKQVKKLFKQLRDCVDGVSLVGELSNRSLDYVMSFGEQLSSLIIDAALQDRDLDSHHLDSRQIIRTDSTFGEGRVDQQTTNEIASKVLADLPQITVAGGFIASNSQGETVTLGRSGSDYTASILGAALNADSVEIWTDVDGVLTADPRKVPSAFPLEQLTYREAEELAHFGAKVIHPKTMMPVRGLEIPIVIKNTFNPKYSGTSISPVMQNGHLIKGVTSVSNVALLTIQGNRKQRITDIARRTFETLAKSGLEILLTTQGSSEQALTVCVKESVLEVALYALNNEFQIEIETNRVEPIIISDKKCVIAAVGENMRGSPGSAAMIFTQLSKQGINIVAIAQGSSELNISLVIDQEKESRALNAIHQAFFFPTERNLNIYVIGTGLIGSALLNQIRKVHASIYKKFGVTVRVIGVINRRSMVTNSKGIDLKKWQRELKHGPESDMDLFMDELAQKKLPNRVVVDCTASQEIADLYSQFLINDVSVVTPNKKAVSGSMRYYNEIHKLSRQRARVLYEATVGAGLPVISTLQDLVHTGDRVESIEAVLSGTLSYIFNEFSDPDNTKTFSEIVRDAQAKGYTEPDPREDLNGMDVARKILILGREIGHKLEPDDVKLKSLIDEKCERAESIEDFYKELKKLDPQFEKQRQKALKENKVLRYMATLKNGKAAVSVVAINKKHPFYGLAESDNIFAIKSERYNITPLVIKGPGGGAEVTATGVFADILRLGEMT